MNKKIFESFCSKHIYEGYLLGRRNKIRVVYFGYEQVGDFRGYKYAVASKSLNLKQLVNALHDWAIKGNRPVHYDILTRYAETDKERFKVSLSFNRSQFN